MVIDEEDEPRSGTRPLQKGPHGGQGVDPRMHFRRRYAMRLGSWGGRGLERELE